MRAGSTPARMSVLLATAFLIPYACTDDGPSATTGERRSQTTEARSSPSVAEQIDLASLPGRIVFSAGPPYAEDIYVIDADGTGFRQVTTDPAADFDPTWSPDGRSIAYRHQPGDDGTTSIYVTEVDGTGARNVSGADHTPDWGPAWSPDGRWIAWNTARHLERGFDLGLVRPNGRGLHVVESAIHVEYPAWSPDGQQIAFMSQVASEGSQYDIFVMDADGTDVRRLTDFRGDDGWPAWSPDGTRILFTSIRDDCLYSDAPDCRVTRDLGEYHTLYLMNADGSDETRVSFTFGQIADWSPNGRYIVFEDFEGMGSGLNVMRADGSGLVTIPTSVPYPTFPDWIS